MQGWSDDKGVFFFCFFFFVFLCFFFVLFFCYFFFLNIQLFDFEPSNLKVEPTRDIIIPNNCVKVC